LVDIDGDRAATAAHQVGFGHLGLRADIACADAVRNVAEQVVSRYGRLDVWVNNAGVLPHGRLATQPGAVAELVSAVNLGGVVHGCRSALEWMLPAGRGLIVNIASVCALKPLPGLAVYSASKAGVLALSESLRRELRGTGVRVSVVLPYLVHTRAADGLQPRVLRPLTVGQVADAVAATVRRPRSRVVVPRYLGWGLALSALLPERVRDAVDSMLRLDDLALCANEAARAAYDAEVAELAAGYLPPGTSDAGCALPGPARDGGETRNAQH
jgi:NAD(P)-dependent dehydrogenase (short-subunit alcohol dehydrogenase family)